MTMNPIAIFMALFLVLYSVPSGAQVTSTGCGTTKGCFQNPSGCNPTSASCQFASWIYDSTSQIFTFEISGASSGKYISIAFTSIAGMEQGDGYICTGTNQLIATTIGATAEPTDDASLPTGVALSSATATNGFTQCTFTRPASVTKTISGSSINFDLSANTYYLLIAGAATDDGSTGSITSYHGTSKALSGKIDFTTVTGGSAVGISRLLKAHAALMVISWMMLAHFGFLVARFYKPTWPHKKLNGAAIWFHMHRGAMVTVFTLTIIGFIIIFVEIDGFVVSGTSSFSHAIMGIVVTALVITNPIMAVFRPNPDAPKRWIFNVCHFLVGLSARVIAIVNMFFGLALPAMGLPAWPKWILVAFLCMHGVIEIILEIMKWTCNIKPASRTENIDMSNNHTSEPQDLPEPHAGSKTAILVLYVLTNVGLTIGFLVAIGQA